MNKKNIILVSKACLLLSMLGFCIPVFDETNGFAALIYFLGAGEGALYVSIGIALILCFLAMAASILFSSLYFIRGKNENHTKQTAAADWALMGLIILTLLFSFIAVKKFTDEDVEFSTGFYFMVYGMAAHIIVYLYSTLLGENLSTKSEEKRAYWMLSLPAIIFYFGVMTFPSIFSVVLSLTNYSGGSLFEAGALKFVGFKNYMKVFADQYFYISLKNNFCFRSAASWLLFGLCSDSWPCKRKRLFPDYDISSLCYFYSCNRYSFPDLLFFTRCLDRNYEVDKSFL